MVKTSTTSQKSLASNAKVSDPENIAMRSAFRGAAIGMSWQLAIIVLLPILGGYKLDATYGSTPLWTLVGLCLALVGSVLVIRRALSSVNNFSIPEPPVDTSSDGVKHV